MVQQLPKEGTNMTKNQTYNVEDRENVLGFRPQREIIYNTLLPYADRLDKESNIQLADIKSQIGRAVLLRDLKISGVHWVGQLSRYMRMYGMKFSFEDHIHFIKLIYEIISTPGLQYSLIQKYAIVLITLLKKPELIPRRSLVLPWRPLYLLYDNVVNSTYEHHGMVYFPDNIENTLESLIRCSRVYFSVESTQEMLDEWRPLMCPFDIKMGIAMTNFDHFLPTLSYPEEHEHTFKLWFGEFISIYCSTTNTPPWELSLVSLFTRLSQDCAGYVNWEPYHDQIFTRILRGFDLPVGLKKVEMRKHQDCYEVGIISKWIVYMIMPSSTALDHVCKMFKALEFFYHPSNHGKWMSKLLKLLPKLSIELVNRVQRENWSSIKEFDKMDEILKMRAGDWRPEIPQEKKMTEKDLTTFINGICPLLLSAMFSKSGSNDAATTFKNLSLIRPEIVIPPLLEWTYSALETLTEPHRLTACLQCTISVVRSMVIHWNRYPDGPSHAIPLLHLSLPGIDPNDLKKSLMTFQLITTLASLIPIVDCSRAPEYYKDLTKQEHQLCLATAAFEDVVLLYFDRVISMIENSVHHHARSDTATSDRMSSEEVMLELCLLSSTNSILQQTSLPIFQEVLKKLQNLALGSVFETRVAGRFTSKLIKAASKARPELVLPKFVPWCCSLLIKRFQSEDLSKEEHLDNEILWHLMLLSEIVTCDGKHVVTFSRDITAVIEFTLLLKCKEAADLSATLLKNVLWSTSSIYAMDYRSSAKSWDVPLSQFLPIREWGASADLFHLNMKWHIPSAEEKEFIQSLLDKFLLSQLEKIRLHCHAKKSENHYLNREELCRRLNVIHFFIHGACAMLPSWKDEPLQLVNSPVPLRRFSLVSSLNDNDAEISSNGRNIRLLIAEHMELLLDSMPCDKEDDTKSLLVIIKIINALFHTYSSSKEEFDGRWKARNHIKLFMANKLIGKKKHIRPLLVDRIQLQHDLRTTNQAVKYFTIHHQIFYKHLFQLATSRYLEVRRVAQASLASGFRIYAYSYLVILDDILKVLQKKPDADINDHQFKGVLYIILGESKQSLATRRNLDLVKKLWPALVLTPYCEKSSVNAIHDSIIDKIHKDIETIEIIVEVTPYCLDLAKDLWRAEKSIKCSVELPSIEQLQLAAEMEAQHNKDNLKSYYDLVENLTNIATKENLYWRFQQVCFEMLSLLIRYDVPMPCSSVKLFVENMNNNMINIRKISIHSISALLKQQKRSHQKATIDPSCKTLPYGINRCLSDAQKVMTSRDGLGGEVPVEEFQKAKEIHSAGIKKRESSYKVRNRFKGYAESLHRPPTNNWWLMFWSKDVPTSEEAWNDFVFINKTHFGYYAWPKSVIGYQPTSAQPKLGRPRSELSECERPIFDAFNDKEFVSTFIKYLSMEEHKGKESFRPKHFTFFKGLFRNYDDTVVELIRQHVENMVSDINNETQESNHRCSAEIIAGLIRGSKHWTFSKRQHMWSWMVPVLKKVLHNLSVVNINDWGTCFATASENQDPRKLAPMFDLLLENPLSEVGGSFGDSSRLYLVQGLLAQQEWRVPELLHNLLDFLTLHLKHFYKNVRDRIGSLLVSIFLFDVSFYSGFPTTLNPHLDEFLELIIPKLLLLTYLSDDKKPSNEDPSHKLLLDSIMKNPLGPSSDQKGPRPMSNYTPSAFLASEEIQKGVIRLFKTVLKGLQGVYMRMFQVDHPEVLKLLPVMAALESYTADTELNRECSLTLAIISQSLLSNSMVVHMLNAVEEVANMGSWHARSAILNFLQKLIFGNLYLMQRHEIVDIITNLLLKLLMDEQLEVRELAGVTLSGFIQCGYVSVSENLLSQFKLWGSTKIGKKAFLQRSNVEVSPQHLRPHLASLSISNPMIDPKLPKNPDVSAFEKMQEMSILKRHAGVIGMCACVTAAPYDVPVYVPDLLVLLSYHLNDPQPIQMTVKRSMGSFKRTHHENWHNLKQKFTDDQLGILTELLVSPNYYA